jgi:hypothetical protein
MIGYSVIEDTDPLVAQLWLYPDESLEGLLSVHHRSASVWSF